MPVGVYRVDQSWDSPRRTFGRRRAPRPPRCLLPLANISPDPKDEYFAEAVSTEELISVLSQVQGLSVIARTSIAPYKLAPKSVARWSSTWGFTPL